MRISDYLDKHLIAIDLKADHKDEAIKKLVGLMKNSDGMLDYPLFITDVLEREKIATTGIGNEVAIPHARTDAVNKIKISLGVSAQGINFDSLDGKKVKIIFLIGTPKSEINTYLVILAQLTRLLRNVSFREEICKASDPSTIMEIFKKSE
ncbi:MAG: PTS sugar transporter subunit IIA [Endomicrobiales bacterium]|nr:PTS sugar transporter subunit IIA [Endomicrobiales bacterium]